MRRFRIVLGAAFWASLAAWIGRLATAERGGGGSTVALIADHVLRASVELEVRFERPVLLEVGDAVYEAGGRDPIGEVCALLGEEGEVLTEALRSVSTARIEIFDTRRTPVHRGARLRLVVVPEMAGAWVWKTLINERTAPRIREAWSQSGILAHKTEILERLAPILQGVLADCERTLEAEARPFLERHRPEIVRVVERVEAELGREELARLFEEEVWPVLRNHLDPVLDTIGAEVWERTPLWSFTWKVLYQSLPLTADDHFKKRWDEFVEEEVVPILKSHSQDIVDVARQVAKETLADPEVRGFLHEFVLRLSSDAEFHRLGYAFLEEVFLANPRFRERIRERWEAPEARELVRFVSEKLEPTVRAIGDIVLGTRETGITPEFARVLRSQVLEKDRQRLVLERGLPSEPPLVPPDFLVASVETEVPR